MHSLPDGPHDPVPVQAQWSASALLMSSRRLYPKAWFASVAVVLGRPPTAYLSPCMGLPLPLQALTACLLLAGSGLVPAVASTCFGALRSMGSKLIPIKRNRPQQPTSPSYECQSTSTASETPGEGAQNTISTAYLPKTHNTVPATASSAWFLPRACLTCWSSHEQLVKPSDGTIHMAMCASQYLLDQGLR